MVQLVGTNGKTTCFKTILTDKSGNYYPAGIPPNLITEKSKNYMRESSQLPNIIRDLVRNASPFCRVFKIYALIDYFLTRWFTGDAACTARPHVGLGFQKLLLMP